MARRVEFAVQICIRCDAEMNVAKTILAFSDLHGFQIKRPGTCDGKPVAFREAPGGVSPPNAGGGSRGRRRRGARAFQLVGGGHLPVPGADAGAVGSLFARLLGSCTPQRRVDDPAGARRLVAGEPARPPGFAHENPEFSRILCTFLRLLACALLGTTGPGYKSTAL
jgi:hypothetical protein